MWLRNSGNTCAESCRNTWFPLRTSRSSRYPISQTAKSIVNLFPRSTSANVKLNTSHRARRLKKPWLKSGRKCWKEIASECTTISCTWAATRSWPQWSSRACASRSKQSCRSEFFSMLRQSHSWLKSWKKRNVQRNNRRQVSWVSLQKLWMNSQRANVPRSLCASRRSRRRQPPTRQFRGTRIQVRFHFRSRNSDSGSWNNSATATTWFPPPRD